MKKRGIVILLNIFIIIILTIILLRKQINSTDQNIETNIEAPKVENIEIDKNQIEYQENTTVEDLKPDTSNTDIYEISEEYDGRKNLKVKDSVQYKVALIGIFTKSKPDLSNVNKLYEKYKIAKNGIWVTENSRENFLKLLENNTKNRYKFDKDGYLKIEEKSSDNNDNDNKIEKLINNQNQYIIDISGEIYNVDSATGNIELYPFEQLDAYQSYEYVQDKGDYVIVLTKNQKKKLTNSSILKDLLALI